MRSFILCVDLGEKIFQELLTSSPSPNVVALISLLIVTFLFIGAMEANEQRPSLIEEPMETRGRRQKHFANSLGIGSECIYAPHTLGVLSALEPPAHPVECVVIVS